MPHHATTSVDATADMSIVAADVSQLLAIGGAPSTIGNLSHPAPVLTGSVRVTEVDHLFAQHRALRAVIVDSHGRLTVLTRDHLQSELTGRLGYGRALHARTVVAELLPDTRFSLPASMTPAEAARLLLTRDEATRYDDVLVLNDDQPQLVAVSRVFQEVADEFRHVALHDALTGLPNRRFLDEHAARLTSAAGRTPIAILYIDLDGFKLVNDTYGHRAGDLVLAGFAQRLRTCLRPGDIAIRVGGDEFVVLVIDVTSAQADAVAERLLLAASAPFVCDAELVYLSASVGVYTTGSGDSAPDDSRGGSPVRPLDVLLRNADAAMLAAKNAGRARISHFPSADDAPNPITRETRLMQRLQTALTNDELSLVYQPQLNLRTGRCDVVEALARWTDGDLGPVSPAEFIPLAERSDQINRLGRWAIDNAAVQARAWLVSGRRRIVSINVSPRQLADGRLLDSLTSAIRANDIPASLLRIEITESLALLDIADAANQLLDIRNAGFEVELDDFGTGFSSLARIRHLPLSTIKIDKSLIDAIDTDPGDRALIQGLIAAAHHHGLSVTAEGVERAPQLDALHSLGCDSVQGYYVSRPLPARELDR